MAPVFRLFLCVLTIGCGSPSESSSPSRRHETPAHDLRPETDEPESVAEPLFRVVEWELPLVFPDPCWDAAATTAEGSLDRCRSLRRDGTRWQRRFCRCDPNSMIVVDAGTPIAFYRGCCWQRGDTPAEAHAACLAASNERPECARDEEAQPRDVVEAIRGPFQRDPRAVFSDFEEANVHVYLDREGSWLDGTGQMPCFPAGTNIRLERGLVPIEDVRTRDYVLTLNDEHRWVRAKINAIKQRQANALLIVRFENGQLRATPEHPIRVAQEWRPAREIVVGDMLTTPDGETQVLAVDIELTRQTVYTLSTDAPHSFFAEGILVHNY